MMKTQVTQWWWWWWQQRRWWHWQRLTCASCYQPVLTGNSLTSRMVTKLAGATDTTCQSYHRPPTMPSTYDSSVHQYQLHYQPVNQQYLSTFGWQEGHPAHKKIWGNDGGGHWLGRMEWHPERWSVCLPPLAPWSPEVLFWHRLTWVVPEKGP